MSEMGELRGKYVLLQAGNCCLDYISSLLGLNLDFDGRGRKSLEVDDCSETFLFLVTLMSASPLSESAYFPMQCMLVVAALGWVEN